MFHNGHKLQTQVRHLKITAFACCHTGFYGFYFFKPIPTVGMQPRLTYTNYVIIRKYSSVSCCTFKTSSRFYKRSPHYPIYTVPHCVTSFDIKILILYDCIIYQIRVTFRGTIDYNISFIQKQYLIFRLIPFSGGKYCTIIYKDILTNVTNM